MQREKSEDGNPLLPLEVEEKEHYKQLLSPLQEFNHESKKLWNIAGPAIFTAVCQYSMGALTQTFAGLVGDLELAAFSVENSVIAGLGFGVMVNSTPISYSNWLVRSFGLFSVNLNWNSFLKVRVLAVSSSFWTLILLFFLAEYFLYPFTYVKCPDF